MRQAQGLGLTWSELIAVGSSSCSHPFGSVESVQLSLSDDHVIDAAFASPECKCIGGSLRVYPLRNARSRLDHVVRMVQVVDQRGPVQIVVLPEASAERMMRMWSDTVIPTAEWSGFPVRIFLSKCLNS